MGERIVGGVADGDAYIQISIKDGAIRLETGTGQQKISWLMDRAGAAALIADLERARDVLPKEDAHDPA